MYRSFLNCLAKAPFFGVYCLALALSSQTAASAAALFVSPSGGSHETDDGTVSLIWEEIDSSSGQERVFEVRRWNSGETGEGTLIYEGPDTASFVSGLAEGDYELRVRSKLEQGNYPQWSDEFLSLKVEYIEMSKVWKLMSAGLVTFLVLLGTLFFGHRATRMEESEEN